MVKLVTVICLVPRTGSGIVKDKGDEWDIGPRRAARLIRAGQVKLKNEADASRLPQLDEPDASDSEESHGRDARATDENSRPELPGPGLPATAGQTPSADEFDDSDALPEVPPAEPVPEPKPTGLEKARARRAGKK